jgi:transposase
MTRAQVEVMTVERRRRWSRVDKERLVAASLEPGASASEIARSAGLHVSQLFRWRKQLCDRVPARGPALIPVDVVAIEPPPGSEPAAPERRRRRAGLIEIDLSGGRRVRVDRDVDVEALRRVLGVLGR